VKAIPCATRFTSAYTAHAPLALAFERTLECKLLAAEDMKRPLLDLGCGDGLFASILFTERSIPVLIPTNVSWIPLKCSAHIESLSAVMELISPSQTHLTRLFFPTACWSIFPISNLCLEKVLGFSCQAVSSISTVPADTFEVWTFNNMVLSSLGLHKTAARYRNFFNKFWKHYHAYHESQWEAMVTKIGFQVEEVSRYNAPRNALANDVLMLLALPSMLLKKFTGHWVLSPTWRTFLWSPLRPLFDIWLDTVRHPSGCLVFVKAIKPSSATL